MKFLLEKCPPNPTLEYAESIDVGSKYTEIVSKGGGSTIDVGKWLARKFNLKHIAIPTTTGTGSEVTKYCVLTIDGKKKTYEDDRFIPDSYILDPSLVISLPYDITLSSGLDALSQAHESLWSKSATRESKIYSTIAIELIVKSFEECLKNPTNEKARMDMLMAANLSGRAINITKTNICHAISYPLTEIYGIPHGIACAMSLKYFAWQLGYKILDYKIPKYKIEPGIVANIVIKSEKIKDYPRAITRQEIINALKQ